MPDLMEWPLKSGEYVCLTSHDPGLPYPWYTPLMGLTNYTTECVWVFPTGIWYVVLTRTLTGITAIVDAHFARLN